MKKEKKEGNISFSIKENRESDSQRETYRFEKKTNTKSTRERETEREREGGGEKREYICIVTNIHECK